MPGIFKIAVQIKTLVYTAILDIRQDGEKIKTNCPHKGYMLEADEQGYPPLLGYGLFTSCSSAND